MYLPWRRGNRFAKDPLHRGGQDRSAEATAGRKASEVAREVVPKRANYAWKANYVRNGCKLEAVRRYRSPKSMNSEGGRSERYLAATNLAFSFIISGSIINTRRAGKGPPPGVRRGGDVARKQVKNPGKQLIDKVRRETFPGQKGYARNVVVLEVSHEKAVFQSRKIVTFRSGRTLTKVVVDN